MRVLVCPDKFRGTLGAAAAAEAIATGWRRIRPDDEIDLAPMADGGEGTAEALVGDDGRWVRATVEGPLGDPVEAALAIAADGTAVVESARASGLAVLAGSRRDPRRTSTSGTGRLLAHALDEGATTVLVCLGGSATNDGGTGMAAALGARFLDGGGAPLAPGGAALLSLARIDLTGLDPRLAHTRIVGLADVTNPLTGPNGASAVFGPQKGASPDDVWLLDRALVHLAAVTEHDLGASPADEPGAGAAGGLGFGLVAFLGARLRPGAVAVAEAVGLDERIAAADLVITGEGAFDATSLGGKVVGHVLASARTAGVPAAILAGRADHVGANAGTGERVEVRTLADEVGTETATGEPWTSLVRVAAALAGARDGAS
jgi:glycerate kinase